MDTYNTNCQEDLHISYIEAICASTGISYDTQRHDEDSTDGIIKKNIVFPEGFSIDSMLRIQLKSTSSPHLYQDHGDYISYKLKAKNYNDLCRTATTPIILGLLVLPEDQSDWVQLTDEELIIKGKMYWASFAGNECIDNTSSKTVKIDKRNIINKETLPMILEKNAREMLVL